MKKIGDSYEGKLEQIRNGIKLGETQYIQYIFDDAVIVNDYGTGKFYEVSYAIVDDEIVVGEMKEVELVYVEKRLQDNPQGTEISGPIFKANGKQRIVYAAVLVPGEPDLDYDKGEKILSAEEIEDVSHKWLLNYGNMDYMHSLNNVAKPVESFILPFEWEVPVVGKLPKGTWVVAAKVLSDSVWEKVESGELTGFSIMGIQNSVMEKILESKKQGDTDEVTNKRFKNALKRTMIKDLGDDWIVPFVSLVDEPCVPKAKFFAIKQKESVWDKIIKYFKKDELGQIQDTSEKLTTMVEKAGRAFSDSTYNELKKAIESLQVLLNKAEEERTEKKEGDDEMKEEDVKKMIDEQLDEKLQPILEAIKEQKAEKQEENEEQEDIDKLKEELETLKTKNAELEKQKEGVTKSQKGQEDGTQPATKSIYEELDRDEFGRAIKRKENK